HSKASMSHPNCKTPHHHTFTLFPYTTLFRSNQFRGNVESFRLAVNQHGDLILRVQAFAVGAMAVGLAAGASAFDKRAGQHFAERSEEHTSELQSLRHLVCRLLLEKKKNIYSN